MKALIIEDEVNCSEVLFMLLQRNVPEVKSFELAESVDEGLQKIKQFKPDIVFLDIQLHDQTCFELLEQLDEINFQLIFTTAYNQYAIKAFEYAAVHYLLKPIILTDLKNAVERCLDNGVDLDSNRIDIVKTLCLRTNIKDYNISYNDILYIKADGSYSTVHTKEGKNVFTSKKLADYDHLLKDGFFRIHHSTIINLNNVEHLDKKNNKVILTNGVELSISRRKKSEFKKAFSSTK